MTQDELWHARWQEAVDFLETNRRKPSKFIPEERNLRSWWKHNKKLMNAGELKPERVEMFKQLLEFGEKYRRKNQYASVCRSYKLWNRLVSRNVFLGSLYGCANEFN